MGRKLERDGWVKQTLTKLQVYNKGLVGLSAYCFGKVDISHFGVTGNQPIEWHQNRALIHPQDSTGDGKQMKCIPQAVSSLL